MNYYELRDEIEKYLNLDILNNYIPEYNEIYLKLDAIDLKDYYVPVYCLNSETYDMSLKVLKEHIIKIWGFDDGIVDMLGYLNENSKKLFPINEINELVLTPDNIEIDKFKIDRYKSNIIFSFCNLTESLEILHNLKNFYHISDEYLKENDFTEFEEIHERYVYRMIEKTVDLLIFEVLNIMLLLNYKSSLVENFIKISEPVKEILLTYGL